jgi:hypothetical protein
MTKPKPSSKDRPIRLVLELCQGTPHVLAWFPSLAQPLRCLDAFEAKGGFAANHRIVVAAEARGVFRSIPEGPGDGDEEFCLDQSFTSEGHRDRLYTMLWGASDQTRKLSPVPYCKPLGGLLWLPGIDAGVDRICIAAAKGNRAEASRHFAAEQRAFDAEMHALTGNLDALL